MSTASEAGATTGAHQARVFPGHLVREPHESVCSTPQFQAQLSANMKRHWVRCCRRDVPGPLELRGEAS